MVEEIELNNMDVQPLTRKLPMLSAQLSVDSHQEDVETT